MFSAPEFLLAIRSTRGEYTPSELLIVASPCWLLTYPPYNLGKEGEERSQGKEGVGGISFPSGQRQIRGREERYFSLALLYSLRSSNR
jgi:hypothetical protein